MSHRPGRSQQTRSERAPRRFSEIADASAYKGEHRHALQPTLDDAHRGEFSVLVVWAVDRLCRQGIEELLRLGVICLTFDRNIERGR
jgi:DNA invertase Pin-like site-specific DNA recombinase